MVRLQTALIVVARVIADSIAEQGYTEVLGVPGDQQTELRRRIRTLARQATGHSCQTLVHESMIVAVIFFASGSITQSSGAVSLQT